MTWEEDLFAFFDDLESQAQVAFDRERQAELADRERAEYATIKLAGRLMASVERDVSLGVLGVGTLLGRIERVANGWLLLARDRHRWIIRFDALTSIGGASDRSVPDIAWPTVARLGLGSALRRVADAGERAVLHCVDGSRHGGWLRRVGSDFVEVAAGGDPPRLLLIPYDGLAAIQSR